MTAKREKIITLRISEASYDSIKDFAKNHGLSVNAYLNSIIDSQAEWFIPISSYNSVTIPKSMMAALFSMANKEGLEVLAKRWAAEAKNIILLSGAEPNIQSVLDLARRISKYFMGTDIRMNFGDADEDDDKNNNSDKAVYAVIRHDAGENFSYFIDKAFENLFQITRIKAFVNHDETTVFIKVESTG